MKKTYLSISLCALLATITFSGCGSSSSSSDDNTTTTSTGTLQLNPYLANVEYMCGNNTGITNNNGEFTYKDGDTCTFEIGGVSLSSSASSNITIDEIANQNENISSEALATYLIAKMSLKTGQSYDVNSLPEVFELPDDIKGSASNALSFKSIDSLRTSLNDETLLEKVDSIRYSVASKFAKKVSVSFEEIATPITDEEKLTQQASKKVYVNGQEQSIAYTTIMRTGYSDNGEILGQSKDYQDNLITFDDGSPYICNGTNDGQGSGMDFTSLHNVDGKLYVISQYECALGSYYMLEIEQDSSTGKLTPKANTLQYVSQKDEFGGWVHCAGQKTPWNSHLSSEEYEPDTKQVEAGADPETGLVGDGYYDDVLTKFWKGDASKISSYYYGWTPEVKIENGKPVYSKHYSMGRFSHELSYVMPDKRTVYMSDDGTNVGLFMFVADKEEDLTAGTLYAAKWNQTSENGVGTGTADIEWVNLGHATNDEIRNIIDPDGNIATNDAPKFTDIFDEVAPTNGECATGYTSISANGIGQECLKIKEGMEKAASRLEVRRYAAMKGATTEFRKEEGITFDKNSGTLYVAMSEVRKGMEDNSSNDVGGPNHIRVEANKCGAVYGLDVSTDTSDSLGADINSDYVVKNMYSILQGTEMAYADDSIYAGNTCDVNGISNPDNVSFLENSNTLIIGEDTGSHKNNVVWAYNIKTKELTRTFTTPLGAETTSPFWYANLKDGYGYLGVVTQHPSLESTDGGESAFGYVGPFKNLTQVSDSTSISSITKIATYKTQKEGGTEIVAFDKDSKKMFTTNGADNTLDITPITYNNDEMILGTVNSIDLSSYGAGVQSVAVKNSKVAVAIGSSNKVEEKGKVVVFDTNGSLISQTQVGYLPDMVTFNEEGTKVIVANEGEPSAKTGIYIDVVGSVGVITLENADSENNTNGYAEVDFGSASLTNANDGTPVRLGGTPSNDKALDIEPEYIAVSGEYAYVTLQENNAIAKVDISSETPTIELVKSLGAKDYSSKNTIDIEEEGETLLKNYKGLYGLYMPDSIASYEVNGKTYLVTANEGDGREYCSDEDPDCDNPVFIDEAKIKKLDLSSDIASAYENENDLKVITDMGDTNSDGTYEKLYAFGARSFTIWDENANLIWDSKDELSKYTTKFMPTLFNQDEGEKDGRSGNKGVEPEALTIGKVGSNIYAFVGLERQNAIVIYDITNPAEAKFVKYIVTENEGDISPEGMSFVEAKNSPTNNPLLMVAFEVSGSTSIYEIR